MERELDSRAQKIINLTESIIRSDKPLDLKLLIERKFNSIEYRFLCGKDHNLSKKKIKYASIVRPQFLLAGYLFRNLDGHIVVFGETELKFLQELKNKDRQIRAIENVVQFDIPCVFVSNPILHKIPKEELIQIDRKKYFEESPLPEYLIERFEEKEIPVIYFNEITTVLMSWISDVIDDFFSLKCSLHGCLVDVFGVGILIMGESGIGKSELSLDLLEKGHRLVADDLVIMMRKWGHRLFGFSSSVIIKKLEVRGIGILDPVQLFGSQASSDIAEVQAVTHLFKVNELNEKIERYKKGESRIQPTELEFAIYDNWHNARRDYPSHLLASILGKRIPLFPLATDHGKNLSALVEAIASYIIAQRLGYESPATRLSAEASRKDGLLALASLPPSWFFNVSW
ncbi:MAG: hypothetical protein N2517_08930 [Ignavibacteria bacterium]|nr:hypothetical protein [Ignavibacteria bacterium]